MSNREKARRFMYELRLHNADQYEQGLEPDQLLNNLNDEYLVEKYGDFDGQ